MKLLTYTLVSIFAVLLITWDAWNQYKQFYPAAIHLSQSQISLVALINFAILLMFWLSKGVMRLFFGELRAIETEHLYERGWFAISETALAMTIFRDEIGSSFVIQFTFLLAIKCFHWVLKDRIDMMDQLNQLQVRNKPYRLIFRTLALIFVLYLIDLSAVLYSAYNYKVQGPSILMMFGFEYLIQSFSLTQILGKLSVLIYDSIWRRYLLGLPNTDDENDDEDNQWEEKTLVISIIEMIIDFFKLAGFLAFFIIIMQSYGLPLYFFRDLYYTAKSFIQKVGDLVKYRRAVLDLKEKLRDVSIEDVQTASDGQLVCIICREDITLHDVLQHNDPRLEGIEGRKRNRPLLDKAKKLNCGHMFHYRCLKGWLERQQNCPTCRRSIFEDNLQNANTNANQNQDVQNINFNNLQNVNNNDINLQDQSRRQSSSGTRLQQSSTNFTPIYQVEDNGVINYGKIKLVPIKYKTNDQEKLNVNKLIEKSEQDLLTIADERKRSLIQRIITLEQARKEIDESIQNVQNVLNIIDQSEG